MVGHDVVGVVVVCVWFARWADCVLTSARRAVALPWLSFLVWESILLIGQKLSLGIDGVQRNRGPVSPLWVEINQARQV